MTDNDKLNMPVDKFAAAKWSGEPCPNPTKGWIRDSRGNRITRLGNRNAFGKLIQLHNQEIELLERTYVGIPADVVEKVIEALQVVGLAYELAIYGQETDGSITAAANEALSALQPYGGRK